MRALIVENDEDYARDLTLLLQHDGYVFDHVKTGDEVLELIRAYECDVILLSVNLRNCAGHAVLQHIRNSKNSTPIVMLSITNDPHMAVMCLDLGADDFLCKKMHGGELLARLRAVIRRRNGSFLSTIRIGDIELDLNRREVTVRGKPVRFRNKEYAVCELLMLRRNTIVPRWKILDHLYAGMDAPGPKVIDVYICNIRKKFAQLGLLDVICTVNGLGFMMKTGA